MKSYRRKETHFQLVDGWLSSSAYQRLPSCVVGSEGMHCEAQGRHEAMEDTSFQLLAGSS